MTDLAPQTPPAGTVPIKNALAEIMGEFIDGMTFIETAIKAMAYEEEAPELDVLKHGMATIQAAYDKLDGLTSKLEK